MTTPQEEILNSPIEDLNGDGKLDGQEIIAQLNREEEDGSNRTPQEAVHGVFETMGVRKLAKDYADEFLQAQLGNRREEDISELNQLVAEQLNQKIPKLLQEEAALSEEEFKALHEKITSSDADPAIKEIQEADSLNYHAFAKSFKTIFPNGIEIKAEDVPVLMNHFAPLTIVIPLEEGREPQKSPQRI